MDTFEVDTLLKEYTDRTHLGQGSFGKVYKAKNTQGKDVVIKVIRFQTRSHPPLDDCKNNEINVLEKLKEETHCRDTLCLEVSFTQNMYTVLIYTWVADSCRLDPDKFDPDTEVPVLLPLLADGLALLHNAKIVHNDIKPENIMLVLPEPEDQRQYAYFIDFGLACHPVSEKCPCFENGGTLLYMAPEVLKGSSVWTFENLKRCDIFSLGVVFYELRHQKHPVSVNEPNHWNLHNAWNRRPRPDLKDYLKSSTLNDIHLIAIDYLIEGMLSYSPEKRPTIAQVVTALKTDMSEMTNIEDAIQTLLITYDYDATQQ